MAKRIDRKIQVSSTHVDSQNEAMSKGALESMVKQSQERAIWLGIEHDIIFPPLGKTGNSLIEQLEDGHYALFSDFIFYDEDDYVIQNLDVNYLNNISIIEYSENETSIAFNPCNLTDYSKKVLEGIEHATISEKFAQGDINLYINLGIFIAAVFGKKYIEGAMEGLGINPSEIGRKHGYFIKESFSNSISPILEKLQRAFLASEFKNKRLRIAYRFHINTCEVSCVLPFDAGIFDVEALKIGASFISIIAKTLIDDYIDLVEADKVIFSFDRGSNK